MDGRDILSWLLALAVVGAILAGAFVTLAALRPEAIEFEATEVTESIARDISSADIPGNSNGKPPVYAA